jgi:hypothetical protein
VHTKSRPAANVLITVEESAEVESDLYLPIRLRTRDLDKPSMLTELRVTSMNVNKPIKSSELVAKFPEGIKVEEPTQKLIYIWGKNGPAVTFNSQKELIEYESRFFTKNSTPNAAKPQPKSCTLVTSSVLTQKRLLASRKSPCAPN